MIKLKHILTEDEIKEFQAEGFDLDEFLKMNSFASQARYANEKLQRISRGSGRIVFIIDDKTVLKLAKNAKGIAQNEVESDLSNDYMVPENIIAQVLESDEKFRWIVMQRAKKIGKPRFKQLMNGIDIETFGKYIKSNTLDYKGGSNLPQEIIEKLNENEFAQDVIELLNNFDLPVGDYTVITSYGEIDGNLVIIDYGLNKEVSKIHYEEPRKRAAEKRRNKQYKFHEVSAKLEGVIN